MKHFTTVHDVKSASVLVEKVLERKTAGRPEMIGKGKTLGLIFLNPSLRTRLSSQKAAKRLGMDVMTLNIDKESWAIEWDDNVVMDGTKVEHIKDAAAVLGQYCDIIGIRSFPLLLNRKEDYGEKMLLQLMRYCHVPVISLESATLHPLQSLADAVSIRETWKEDRPPKIALTWAPHIKPLPQAVANSFSEWMLALKANLFIAQPKGYELCDDYTRGANICYSQEEALANADYVYVKNWSSYSDYGKILSVEDNWKLDQQKYNLTNKARIMHCLPVRRGLEIDGDLLDHNRSIVQLQAMNRLYAAETVMDEILRGLDATVRTTMGHETILQ
jgi:N-succinyl-L-ornithine transcarbamylase